MSNKGLKFSIKEPLNPGDSESQTYGCRANNPDICKNCYNMNMTMYHEMKRLYGRSYNEPEPDRKDYIACGKMVPSCNESREVVCDAAGKKELS